MIAARESQDHTQNSFLRILTSLFIFKVLYFFVKYTGNYVFRCLLTICTNPDTLPKLKLPDLCVEIQHLEGVVFLMIEKLTPKMSGL